MVFFVFLKKAWSWLLPDLLVAMNFLASLVCLFFFLCLKYWLISFFLRLASGIIYLCFHFFLLFLSLNQLCNTNCFPSLIKLPGGSFPSWSGGELGVQINRALIGLVVWFVCLPHCARVSCCNEGLTGVCCGYHSMQWSVPCIGNSSCFVFLARPIEKLLPPSAEAVYVLNNFTVLLNKEICIFL